MLHNLYQLHKVLLCVVIALKCNSNCCLFLNMRKYLEKGHTEILLKTFTFGIVFLFDVFMIYIMSTRVHI